MYEKNQLVVEVKIASRDKSYVTITVNNLQEHRGIVTFQICIKCETKSFLKWVSKIYSLSDYKRIVKFLVKIEKLYMFWKLRCSLKSWIASASAVHNNQKRLFTDDVWRILKVTWNSNQCLRSGMYLAGVPM